MEHARRTSEGRPAEAVRIRLLGRLQAAGEPGLGHKDGSDAGRTERWLRRLGFDARSLCPGGFPNIPEEKLSPTSELAKSVARPDEEGRIVRVP